jgi:hypothetical protein
MRHQGRVIDHRVQGIQIGRDKAGEVRFHIFCFAILIPVDLELQVDVTKEEQGIEGKAAICRW